MPYTTYTNSIPNYNTNMYRYEGLPLYRSPMNKRLRQRPGQRPIGGGFIFPFALGFLSAPLLLPRPRPRPRPRPNYGFYPYGPGYYPYY